MIALLRGSNRRDFAVLVYAIAAVILYACALPLWEGWDEPFHYGYVETLAVQHQFPVLNRTTTSDEISRSLTLTPLPRFLAKAVKGSVSFEDWHEEPREARTETRRQLAELPSVLRRKEGDNPNYEAQQTPLAYLILVPFDSALGHVQLLGRILSLRIVGAGVSILFSFLALLHLSRSLQLPAVYRTPLLFCALSIQVLWAAVSHVGNDALAIPLTLWFLALLSEPRRPLLLAAVFAAGLLAKAYFLSFAPVFVLASLYRWRKHEFGFGRLAVALALPAAIAAPWYIRNLRLYHSFSGTQESASGIRFAKAMTAVPHIHWLRSSWSFFRSSLWTGDWSFVAYSRGTLLLEELLLVAGLILYIVHRRRAQRGEWMLWLACACFVGGLFYQTCVTWVHTHGEATMPEPWYWQGVLACLFALSFAGFARAGRLGTGFAAVMVAVSGWVAFSTFWVKMLPGYGGGIHRATLPVVFRWWTGHPALDLRDAALASPWVVFVSLACFTAMLVSVEVVCLHSLVARNADCST